MMKILPLALSPLLVSLGLQIPPALAGTDPSIAETIARLDQALTRDDSLLRNGAAAAPVWLSDSESFLYAHNGPDDFTVFLVDPLQDRVVRLSDDQSVRNALAGAGSESLDLRLVGLSQDRKRLLIDAARQIYLYDLLDHSAAHDPVLTLHARSHAPQVISDQFPTTFGPLREAASPDGSAFITVRDHNLYIRPATGGAPRQLTTDGHLHETWLNTQESAQSFNVHWSPDGSRIAAIQLDTRDVWHEPLPRLLENPPRADPVAYPRAGEPMHRFRVFVIDVETGEHTRVEAGDTEDHYVDLIGWRADGKAVLLQIIDREHKRLRVVSANADSGQTSLLLDESTQTYFDTWMTLGIHPVRLLSQSNGFLYLSENSGWRHIQVRAEDGSLMRTLTRGAWAVHDIVRVDESNGLVYFNASMDAQRPYDLQLYSVSVSGQDAPTLLTSGSNRNDIVMSPGNRFFLAHRSSPDTPPVVELRASDGTLVRTLSTFDPIPLLDAGFGGMESFVARDLSNSWDMHGTIIKPFHFDPAQKYPVVEIIYGGMQSFESRHQYFGFGRTGRISTVGRALLHSGFVLVLVDAPGTPGRGRRFQDAVYGTWPQTVIGNHVHAIRQAARTRPWMDMERVAVYGHSWGAFMAQHAMIEAPDFYRAAVAHNGGSDLYDQPTYIEPFMGMPANNPRNYEAASVLPRVDEFRGPILVFSSPLDVNSGFSPAFKLVDAMVRARKDIQMFVMPETNHRLYCCSRDQELYKLATIERFLKRVLQSGRAAGH
jgi:dipeptidyl aminopeptidase/acylaminoacyl peptidase